MPSSEARQSSPPPSFGPGASAGAWSFYLPAVSGRPYYYYLMVVWPVDRSFVLSGIKGGFYAVEESSTVETCWESVSRFSRSLEKDMDGESKAL